MDSSEAARALVKFARGVPKTMTPAAMKQRRQAAKNSANKRRGKKRCHSGKT